MRVFIEKAKKTDFAFWPGVKDITDAKTPPPAVSLEDMVKELHDRINIPTDIPADFDLGSWNVTRFLPQPWTLRRMGSSHIISSRSS